MLILPFVIGAEVVILTNFSLPALLDTIVKYQIAEIQVVPPILIRLIHDPIVEQYDLSCVKRFASGAAPINGEVLQLLEKKFPGRGFKQGYGMTESCGCITTHPLDKHAFMYARTGGTLLANTEVKVVNAEGKVVGVDEKGEVNVKSMNSDLHSNRQQLADLSKRSTNGKSILQTNSLFLCLEKHPIRNLVLTSRIRHVK